MRRAALIALAALAFLAVSFSLARVLTAPGRERSAIAGLLADEARGDAGAALARLTDCDAACVRAVRATARRLAGEEEVEIVRLDSDTAYALSTQEGWARVVWVPRKDADPVVQCVRVRRSGSPLTGSGETELLHAGPLLSDNEGSC